uniref:Uncharacterized protein n=1 Tax=Oryza rufipogon TaxID=4529 RepID=A0A0E0QNV9_ORYRU
MSCGGGWGVADGGRRRSPDDDGGWGGGVGVADGGRRRQPRRRRTSAKTGRFLMRWEIAKLGGSGPAAGQ